MKLLFGIVVFGLIVLTYIHVVRIECIVNGRHVTGYGTCAP